MPLGVADVELATVCNKYGRVAKVMVLHGNGNRPGTTFLNGLVEFEEVRMAAQLIAAAQSGPVHIQGRQVRVQFAKQSSLDRSRAAQQSGGAGADSGATSCT